MRIIFSDILPFGFEMKKINFKIVKEAFSQENIICTSAIIPENYSETV
jgi:hypothetical protein